MSDVLRIAARLAFRTRCRLARKAARELLVLAKSLEQSQ